MMSGMDAPPNPGRPTGGTDWPQVLNATQVRLLILAGLVVAFLMVGAVVIEGFTYA